MRDTPFTCRWHGQFAGVSDASLVQWKLSSWRVLVRFISGCSVDGCKALGTCVWTILVLPPFVISYLSLIVIVVRCVR